MENRGWNGKIVNSTLQFKTRNKKREKKKGNYNSIDIQQRNTELR